MLDIDFWHSLIETVPICTMHLERLFRGWRLSEIFFTCCKRAEREYTDSSKIRIEVLIEEYLSGMMEPALASHIRRHKFSAVCNDEPIPSGQSAYGWGFDHREKEDEDVYQALGGSP